MTFEPGTNTERSAPARVPQGPRTPRRRPFARIAAVGVDLPRRRLGSAELVASCRHPIAADLERLTGIRERRVCAEGEDSFSMAIAAARECLDRSGRTAHDLEMIVSCSISKGGADMAFVFEPPMSVAIQRGLGAADAVCFDVANACAGMMTGLAIVDDAICRGDIRRGMVVSGEFISHIGRTAARNARSVTSPQMPSMTLGDAGAAVLLERAEDGEEAGLHACELVSFARWSDLCVAKPADPDDELGWAMRTDALALHRVAIDASTPTILQTLERAGVAPDQIDWVIPHQTTRHAIRAGAERLLRSPRAAGFRAQVIDNLESCGNTASTSHFVALHRCLVEGRLRPGERILLLCFASGVVVGAAVLVVDRDLVERYARGH